VPEKSIPRAGKVNRRIQERESLSDDDTYGGLFDFFPA
jgi:hypothetical protein